jgi:hypothetical protein
MCESLEILRTFLRIVYFSYRKSAFLHMLVKIVYYYIHKFDFNCRSKVVRLKDLLQRTYLHLMVTFLKTKMHFISY